ncbi:hypothetical protein [Anaerotignum sp.]|uniref:hypothetical protein n=1 Tax=Anaerotignum sp. TaxID=2039241 RepID=UPI0033299686
MINKNLLMNMIWERGFTTEQIAEKLKLEQDILFKKLEGSEDCFTIKEVQAMVRILEMEGTDAVKIFFA